jgi:glycogen phosphorylase
VRRSKRAMMTVIPQFSTRRMLHDYIDGLYDPAARQYRELAAHDFAAARALAEWKQRVRQAWVKVGLRLLSETPSELPRTRSLRIRVAAALSGLALSDVRVEFVAHRRLPEANFEPPRLSSYRSERHDGLWSAALKPTGEFESDGAAVFVLDMPPPACGQFATEVRIYPFHELLAHPYELGLMKWL